MFVSYNTRHVLHCSCSLYCALISISLSVLSNRDNLMKLFNSESLVYCPKNFLRQKVHAAFHKSHIR